MPGVFVLVGGEKGLPVPIGVGEPKEGSLSYQLIVPPLPETVIEGGVSFKHTGSGGVMVGAAGESFTVTVTWVGALSQLLAFNSVIQKS